MQRASASSVNCADATVIDHVSVVVNELEPAVRVSLMNRDMMLAECRICQEEEEVARLDHPCACTGTLMYAHRECVQRWCDEKGNTTCEICRHPYINGYSAKPLAQHARDFDTIINISDTQDPTEEQQETLMEGTSSFQMVMQHHFMDAQYYEEANSNSSAICCRSIALFLMMLLFLRHGIVVVAGSDTIQEETSKILFLFIFRVIGFLLPCFIMVRAMNMLQRSYQQQQQQQQQHVISMEEGINMHNLHEVSIILQASSLDT